MLSKESFVLVFVWSKNVQKSSVLREKFWQGWQRDSLVCSSIGAKSKEKKHLRSEINQIKSNGDLGKKGDGKIWSKVESGQARGGFRPGSIDLSGLEIPKRKKNRESE
jgi:hypothetical protein